MKRLWAVLLMAGLLGGCASMTRAPEVEEGDRAAWRERREALLALDRWAMQARVGSGGVFGWSGSLRWDQNADRFDILISGPLGMGGLRVAGTPEHLTIRKGGETYVTSDPDTFFERRLHLTFPVSGLRYWALGVPAPGKPARVTVDARGRVTHLEQAGWTLQYEAYRDVADYALPVSFSARNGDTRIKLVVQRWSGLGEVDGP